MIVLIDSEKGQVTVAQKDGMKVMPIDSMEAIAKEIAGRKVYYVTEAEVVDGNAVLDLLSSVTGLSFESVEPTGVLYLRSTAKGKLILKGQDEDIVFENPIDCKPVHSFAGDPKVLFPDLEYLIRKGKIEIIDETEIGRIKEEYNNRSNKPISSREQELDKLIIQDGWQNRLDKISSGEEGDDGIMSLDITQRDLDSGRDMDSETMDNIRQSGVSLDDGE